jgi:glutathione S-transferase
MLLYHTERAPNPMRVKGFLAEKGLWDAFPKVEVSLIGGEHRTPEFREKSPFAQVPALELDDGMVLTESRAIQTYLESVHPEPNLMGVDGRERALIEMWDRRMEMLVMLPVAFWVRHGHPAMAALENPQSAEWAGMNEQRTARMLDRVDSHLGSSDFVVPGRFSVADITLWATLGFARIMKFDAFAGRPGLAAWKARMKDRPAGQA